MVFLELEKYLKERIPADIKQILELSGFETESSLMFKLFIDSQTIEEIEQFANENKVILQNTAYEKVCHFKFKPGHKCILLQLPNQIKILGESQISLPTKMNDFSQILKTFIETAETNFGKPPNGFRYNDINRNFSTFVYLLCGNACYETLSRNLPIPTAHTIRKTTLK